MDTERAEIAATAARLVVEEGMEYGPAKRRAARDLRASPRAGLPDNDEVESAVREYIALYCADSQPVELAALRRLALVWMERLSVFRPHLAGAVWQGTATRRSDIHIQLFCDDPKSAEIALIDHRIRYEARLINGFQGGEVDALSFAAQCPDLGEPVGIHLMVYDHDDLRGALRKDGQGRTPRGDIAAVQRLIRNEIA